jgi:hypothetical protein
VTPQSCAHCHGRVPTIDNIEGRSFWGSVHTTESTETTRTARIAFTQYTRTSARDRVLTTDGQYPLCKDCWLELSKWLGVGRRKDRA